MVLERFQESLETGDIVAQLRAGLIGEGTEIPTPFGMKRLVYADYTASGRPLRQVEDFIAEHVLPYYANSHTEASYCGAYGPHSIIPDQSYPTGATEPSNHNLCTYAALRRVTGGQFQKSVKQFRQWTEGALSLPTRKVRITKTLGLSYPITNWHHPSIPQVPIA